MRNPYMQHQYPLKPSRVLHIALEDPETVCFIKKNFSRPEESPEIITHKWSNMDGKRWYVEIIEKNPFFDKKGVKMINAALIVMDSDSGYIIKRSYFSNLLLHEYIKIISDILCGLTSL